LKHDAKSHYSISYACGAMANVGTSKW